MPADMVKRRGFVNRQRDVENEIKGEGFGELHGFALKRNYRIRKMIFELVNRTETVRMRRRNEFNAAEFVEFFNGILRPPTRRFKRDIARFALD